MCLENNGLDDALAMVPPLRARDKDGLWWVQNTTWHTTIDSMHTADDATGILDQLWVYSLFYCCCWVVCFFFSCFDWTTGNQAHYCAPLSQCGPQLWVSCFWGDCVFNAKELIQRMEASGNHPILAILTRLFCPASECDCYSCQHFTLTKLEITTLNEKAFNSFSYHTPCLEKMPPHRFSAPSAPFLL